jgi:hypothetical protein
MHLFARRRVVVGVVRDDDAGDGGARDLGAHEDDEPSRRLRRLVRLGVGAAHDGRAERSDVARRQRSREAASRARARSSRTRCVVVGSLPKACTRCTVSLGYSSAAGAVRAERAWASDVARQSSRAARGVAAGKAHARRVSRAVRTSAVSSQARVPVAPSMAPTLCLLRACARVVSRQFARARRAAAKTSAVRCARERRCYRGVGDSGCLLRARAQSAVPIGSGGGARAIVRHSRPIQVEAV